MKKSNKIKNNFFDKPYFIYLMKGFVKVKYLYILLSIYLILILSTVLIIPLAININQTELITHTMVLILYVMITAFTGSFLAIHLFRNSISDGTEILICSKPITRREIVFVKSICFILIILCFSFVSSLFSLTIYLNKTKGEMNDLFVVFGIFIGTFISCIFFGSISLCLSLFFSKSKTTLLSVGVIFAISLSSIISMLTSPNIEKIRRSYKDIYFLDTSRIIDRDSKSSNNLKIKIGTFQWILPNENWNIFEDHDDPNAYIYSLSPKEFIDEIYKKNKFSLFSNFFDIGKQMASMFTLTKLSNYMKTSENIWRTYSPPFIYKFEDKHLHEIYENNFVTRNLNFIKIDENEILTKEEIKIINETFNVGLLQPDLKFHMGFLKFSNNLKTYSMKRNYPLNYFLNLKIDESLWEKFLNDKGEVFVNYFYYLIKKNRIDDFSPVFNIFLKTLFGYEIVDVVNGDKIFKYKKNNHFLDFKFKDPSSPKEEEIYYIYNTIQELSLSALVYYSKYQLTEHYSYNKNNYLLDSNSIYLSYFDLVDNNLWDKNVTFNEFFNLLENRYHKFYKGWNYLIKYIKKIWPDYHNNKAIYDFFQYLKNSNNPNYLKIYNKFTKSDKDLRDLAIKRLYLGLFGIEPIQYHSPFIPDISTFLLNKYIATDVFDYNFNNLGELEIDNFQWKYFMRMNFNFRPSGFFQKYTKMSITYIYNGWILIPCWLIISLSIFIIFIFLYERKDFK